MNSWHSARTGRMPVPSPLQQRGIARVEEQRQVAAAQQYLAQHDVSRELDLDPSSDPAAWASVPPALQRAISALIASDAAQRQQVRSLRAACEELRREQAHFTTHAAVTQMTRGSDVLSRELATVRTAQHEGASKTETRLHALEETLTQLKDEVASLRRTTSAAAQSSSSSLEALTSSLAFTQRDLASRAALMAQLGDKLMDEAAASRIEAGEVAHQVRECERRMASVELSMAIVHKIGAGASLAAATAAAAPGSPSTPARSANPLSNQSVLRAHKRDFHVTRDSIQAHPTGSAVFDAVGREVSAAASAAAAATATMTAASASVPASPAPAHLGEHHQHPLSALIEQHHAEKVAAAAAGLDQPQLDAAAADNAAATKDGASVVGRDSVNEAAPHKQLRPASTPTSRRHVPAPPPNAAAAPAASSAVAVVSPRAAPPAAAAALPSSGPPLLAQVALDTPQFQGYLQDYSTRNLQKDLLEIASTYQSTIRNECEGLRSQMLHARRTAAEESARQSARIATLEANVAAHAQETTRAHNVLELFVRNHTSELMERMARVEARVARVDSLSATRAAQVEQKYTERNEEVRIAIADLQRRMDDAFSPRVTSTGGSPNASASAAAHENDLRTLQLNLERLLQTQTERHTSLQHVLVRVRSAGEESARTLGAQIASVAQQMKSLFADALAALDGSAGSAGHAHALHSLLPLLTPASPGVHGSTGFVGEKPRFRMEPRTMQPAPRSARAIRRATTDEQGGSSQAERDSVHSHSAGAAAFSEGEEKQPSGASTGRTGFSTAMQFRPKHTPVSHLSRGHSSGGSGGTEVRRLWPEADELAADMSAALDGIPARPSTQPSPRAARGAVSSRSPERVFAHAVLSTARKDLASRPHSQQHPTPLQRAAEYANEQQDALMAEASTARSRKTPQRPRTVESSTTSSAHSDTVDVPRPQPPASARRASNSTPSAVDASL